MKVRLSLKSVLALAAVIVASPMALPTAANALDSPPYAAPVGPAPVAPPSSPIPGAPLTVTHGLSGAQPADSICTATPFIITGGNHIWDFEADAVCSQEEWQEIEACPTFNGVVQKSDCDVSGYELSDGSSAGVAAYCKGYTAKTWMWYYTPYLSPETSTEYSSSGNC